MVFKILLNTKGWHLINHNRTNLKVLFLFWGFWMFCVGRVTDVLFVLLPKLQRSVHTFQTQFISLSSDLLHSTCVFWRIVVRARKRMRSCEIFGRLCHMPWHWLLVPWPFWGSSTQASIIQCSIGNCVRWEISLSHHVKGVYFLCPFYVDHFEICSSRKCCNLSHLIQYVSGLFILSFFELVLESRDFCMNLPAT